MGLDARDFEGATESRHGPPFPSQPLQRMMWYDTKIVSKLQRRGGTPQDIPQILDTKA